VLPSLLSHPVETRSSPSETFSRFICPFPTPWTRMFLVEMEGIEPSSRMPLL